MFLLIGSFFAGILTVFAPCIFALLPVIIGGSVSGNVSDKRRPLIIAASLSLSLLVFTILLKALSLFANVPPQLFTYISGGILVLLGILLLFPQVYEAIISKFNLQVKSQQLLGKSGGHGSTVSAIITGAALGPVFSSCSPVYVYIIATILPVNFGEAMLYMLAYILGLGMMVLLIGYLGRGLVKKLKFAANPHGWFQRTIAVLFIVVGLLVATGMDKSFQTYISKNTPFDFDALSAKLLPEGRNANLGKDVLNVEDPYDAPEFTGLENWINSEPQTLKNLKGKVVLIDFWTYSCINCIRTQPYLNDWYERYHEAGLEIVGVHAPEFSFEKNPDNVRAAAKKADLKYPIALDNNFRTWAAYENQFWPASYLIDAEGKVRRFHAGEGEYDKTEQAIRALLKEAGKSVPEASSSLGVKVPVVEGQTPETYLGSKRATNYVGKPGLLVGTKSFIPAKLDEVDQWTLSGEWEIKAEGVVARRDAELRIRVAAKDVYLVTGEGETSKEISVSVDGIPISDTKSAGDDIKNSRVAITGAQLYKIVSFSEFSKDKMITLSVPEGVQINVFTFGAS